MIRPNARLHLSGAPTPALRSALGLGPDIWQLTVNEPVTRASYMDSDDRIHHINIDDAQREVLERLLQEMA